MQTFQNTLAERFRAYTNEELVEDLQSGALIASAQKVAQDELKSRGIESIPSNQAAGKKSCGSGCSSCQTYETVAAFSSVADAQLLRAHLEAQGIPSFIPDSAMEAAKAIVLSGANVIQVQVQDTLASHAREIIHAIRNGESALVQLEQPEQQIDAAPAQEKPALGVQQAWLLMYTQDPAWLEVWQGLIDKTGRFASFNLFAAVMGATWFFFRKMYFSGAVVLLADVLILELAWPIGWLVAVHVAVGLLANILYYKKAQQAVSEVQAEPLSREQMLVRLKRKGGISIVGALASVALMFAIWIILRSL